MDCSCRSNARCLWAASFYVPLLRVRGLILYDSLLRLERVRGNSSRSSTKWDFAFLRYPEPGTRSFSSPFTVEKASKTCDDVILKAEIALNPLCCLRYFVRIFRVVSNVGPDERRRVSCFSSRTRKFLFLIGEWNRIDRFHPDVKKIPYFDWGTSIPFSFLINGGCKCHPNNELKSPNLNKFTLLCQKTKTTTSRMDL